MKTFTLTFTEAELETIGAAMDDYRLYAEDEVAENDLIGGLPVLERVNSIDDKNNSSIYWQLVLVNSSYLRPYVISGRARCRY